MKFCALFVRFLWKLARWLLSLRALFAMHHFEWAKLRAFQTTKKALLKMCVLFFSCVRKHGEKGRRCCLATFSAFPTIFSKVFPRSFVETQESFGKRPRDEFLYVCLFAPIFISTWAMSEETVHPWPLRTTATHNALPSQMLLLTTIKVEICWCEGDESGSNSCNGAGRESSALVLINSS